MYQDLNEWIGIAEWVMVEIVVKYGLIVLYKYCIIYEHRWFRWVQILSIDIIEFVNCHKLRQFVRDVHILLAA